MKVNCIDLLLDDCEIAEEYTKTTVKKLRRVNKKSKGINPLYTYLILPDGSYYEVARKDAIRLTDEEMLLFIFKKHGLIFARDTKIVRGHVTEGK